MALIDDVWLSPPMLPALAELTGTHRTTVARWYEKRRLPKPVHLLLQLVWHGRIARIHGAWDGWAIDVRSGELVTPYGVAVTAGEILAIPYRLHELSTLRRPASIDDAAKVAKLPIKAPQFLANPAELDADGRTNATIGGRKRK